MAVIIKDLGVVTAYAYAVAGGYVGTEEEFETLLGNIAEDLANIENLTVTATTLPAGSQATASYSDGHLTLGIPQGEKGEKGDKGNTGAQGETGNGIASITLTSTSGAVKTYTITFTDGTTTTFDVTDGEVTTESLLETLEEYAKIDGLYEDMTVGNAEQLIASDYVTDKAPYLFRKTGESTDVGNREYDALVGASAVWNQLVQNGNFESTSGWSATRGSISASNNILSYTIDELGSGTVQNRIVRNVSLTSGHKYIILVQWKPSKAYKLCISLHTFNVEMYSSVMVAGAWNNIEKVFSCSGDNSSLFLGFNSSEGGSAIGDVEQARSVQIIDLTTFFGSSTIPDYVYSLEQSTAGSGVAWLRQYFPKLFEYHEYDAGTLKSVEGVESHDTVGFNAWDEEWELGVYNTTTGEKASSSTQIRSKNYIRVLPNTNYYALIPSNVYCRRFFYDENKNFVSTFVVQGSSLITVPSGCSYMTFQLGGEYGTTYKNDICINLSNSGYRNGEYEPYWKRSYPLDSTWVGRGIYKLGSDGKPYADGDRYESDGTVTRRYGIVDLGTLEWWKAGTPNDHWRFAAPLTGVAIATTANKIFNAVCTKYNAVTPSNTHEGITGISNNNSNSNIFVCDESYSDAHSFKTAMSGVYLIYELATPTTAEYEPFQSPQICDDFGTEEYVTDCLIPVGHETKYPANLRDKVQHLPDLSNLGNGNYIINQTGTQMSLIPITSIIPAVPTTDGTYKLKCTVSGGQATLTWEVDS